MIGGAASTAPAGVTHLQQTLQAVVQSVHWTYSLFWHLCPQQGVLVWGDGYYNGAIKTRKTVQPVEVSTEEASLQRSQQLRELYESLSTGEANLPARRPCAALSPEDLTEAEWFYLMCISFSFPPGHGLPGKAFARQRHVWLTGANEVDSKVFSRAILAKSANIQTVVCIPLMDGILELGNTEKVEEDVNLIQHAKRFFVDYSFDAHIKPALSEQSTSNPFADHHPLLLQHQAAATALQQTHMDIQASNHEAEDVVTTAHGRRHDDDDDDDDDDAAEEEEEEADCDDDDEGDEIEGSSRSELKAMRYGGAGAANLTEETMAMMKDGSRPTGETSELMQLEISEGVRMGSMSDCSNNLEMEQMPSSMCDGGLQAKCQQRQDEYLCKNWHLLLEDIGNASFQQSLGSRVQDFSPEDAHYSRTVSCIVRQKRWVDSSSSFNSNLFHCSDPKKSAFSRWSSKGSDQHLLAISSSMSSSSSASSQWLLKNVLLGVRDRHGRFSGADDGSSPRTSRDPGGKVMQQQKYSAAAQEEISANHVLAERRRREKLNERFMILRTLVPFVTKMDKASILGDTIEYVKQLMRRIQDLESRNKRMETERPVNQPRRQATPPPPPPPVPQKNTTGISSGRLMDQQTIKRSSLANGSSDKRRRKPQQVDSSEQGNPSAANVQVSVTEEKALLEIRCGYRDGLLLKLMHALHDLGLEITSIEFDSSDGVFNAEVHSKFKEVRGKRAGIVDVKRAIHQIIPP